MHKLVRKDNRESGPQTLSERLFSHTLKGVSTGVTRNGKPYEHPVEHEHYGPAAGCPKCKVEQAQAKMTPMTGESRLMQIEVSKTKLSPMGRFIIFFLVVIVAALFVVPKLSAQTPESIKSFDSSWVVVGGVLVGAFFLWMWLRNSKIPSRDDDFVKSLTTTGEHGAAFTKMRGKHGPHLRKDAVEELKEDGEHGDALTRARRSRSH